jgi:hypothetical protein
MKYKRPKQNFLLKYRLLTSKNQLCQHFKRNRQSKGYDTDQNFIQMESVIWAALEEYRCRDMQETSRYHPIEYI